MSYPGILGVVGVTGFRQRLCWPCRLCKESLVFNFGPFDTLSDSLDPVSDSLLIMLRILVLQITNTLTGLGKLKRGLKVSREVYIACVSRSTNRRYYIAYVILYDSNMCANTRVHGKHIIIAHLYMHCVYKCIACILFAVYWAHTVTCA